MTCPRCHTLALVPEDGSWKCLACGHTNERETLVPLEFIIPPIPQPRAANHEDEMRPGLDTMTACFVAANHGASLEQLQQPMSNWKGTDPRLRRALHATIEDLCRGGMGERRIAKVLKRHKRTIQVSEGWARGKGWTP